MIPWLGLGLCHQPDAKFGGYRSQLVESHVSSHTEVLRYNETVCLRMKRKKYIVEYPLISNATQKLMLDSCKSWILLNYLSFFSHGLLLTLFLYFLNCCDGIVPKFDFLVNQQIYSYWNRTTVTFTHMVPGRELVIFKNLAAGTKTSWQVRFVVLW